MFLTMVGAASAVTVAGWRSSDYGGASFAGNVMESVCQGPGAIDGSCSVPASYWVNAAKGMVLKFPGSVPGAIYTIGFIGETTETWMPNELSTTLAGMANVVFSDPGMQANPETMLTASDAANMKVILSVEPGSADINQLATKILNKYKSHPSVAGFAVDVEWLRGQDGLVSMTPAEATSLRNVVEGINPNYKLIIKHWNPNRLPRNIDRVVYLTDSVGFNSLNDAINRPLSSEDAGYVAWAEYFTGSEVGYQVGYDADSVPGVPDDQLWWGPLGTEGEPAKVIIDRIMAARPSTKIWTVYWADFTIRTQFPLNYVPPTVSTRLNLTVILLTDVQTCVVGDAYAIGNSCKIEGSATTQFADNSNFKGLRPSDPAVNSYAKKVCLRTTLNNTEITKIKSNIDSFVNSVRVDSSNSLILVPKYITYSGEMALSKYGCGLNPYPWDIDPSLRSQINKYTDFIIVVNDIADDSQKIHFGVGPCGGAFGADWGINGAGYTFVPETTILGGDSCTLPNVFFHEWSHQFDYAMKYISNIPDIYNDDFPQSLCGNADPDTYKWFPHSDIAARDPDFPACAAYYDNWHGYCDSIYPRRCDIEFNDHLISAHYKPGTNVIGNHCRNGKMDSGESGIDIGGNGVAACITSDTSPPERISNNPINSATNVGVSKTITVVFNETIQQGTSFNSITLKDASNNVVNSAITISGSVLTINPAANLQFNQFYKLTIPAGAVTDTSNNPLAAEYSFSFTTVSFSANSGIHGAGWRSSEYGGPSVDYPNGHGQTDPTYWINVSKQMAANWPGANLGGIYVIGQIDGDPGTAAATNLSFSKSGSGTYNNINFNSGSDDTNEQFLTAFDNAGLKVWLQVEPADANVEQLIDLVLDQYGGHKSVKGFGIDVERLNQRTNPGGRPVSDADVTAWLAKLKSHNSTYKLFLKHWNAAYLPSTHPEGVVFITDIKNFNSLDSAVSNYTDWANNFIGSEVGFQIGYPEDQFWWGDAVKYPNPAKAIGDAILAENPTANIEGIYWVDFSINTIFPPGIEDTTPPVIISITSPISGQSFTTKTITVSGTASDNVALSTVEARVNSGEWQSISFGVGKGIVSWSITQLNLSKSGSNKIFVRATDTSGIHSDIQNVTIDYNPPDIAPPFARFSDPMNLSINVDVTKTISITFNENIIRGKNFKTITLKDASNNAVMIFPTTSGNTLRIEHSLQNLGKLKKYTVSVPAGAVNDTSNNSLAESYSFSFTTTDGCAGSCKSLTKLYKSKADFDKGKNDSVVYTSGELQLIIRPPTKDTGLLWIANAGEDTVSKWNTSSNREIGRYHTWFGPKASHGAWDGPAPSRTAVDSEGNVYVANRHFEYRKDLSKGKPADVFKIFANLNDCIDRNKNGRIDTSYDVNKDNTISANEMFQITDTNRNGIIDADEITDECVAWVATIGPTDCTARGVALDLNNNLWVGCYGNENNESLKFNPSRAYYQLNGITGKVIGEPVYVSPNTPYGALVDKKGILWSTSFSHPYLLRLDTTTRAWTTISHSAASNDGEFNYGIALGYDANDNTQVYLGGVLYTDKKFKPYIKYNSATKTFDYSSTMSFESKGIATDSKGNIYAGDDNGKVTKFSPSGSVIWTTSVYVPTRVQGIVIDNNGDVWVIHLKNGDKANSMMTKLRGTDGKLIKEFETGLYPYTYSDAAGTSLRTAKSTGTWIDEYDSNYTGTGYGPISWDPVEPDGTNITFEFRATDDKSAWPNWEKLSNGVAPKMKGQYFQIRATFTSTTDKIPSIKELEIPVDCAPCENYQPSDLSVCDNGKLDIAFVLDVSGSMGDEKSCGDLTRLDCLKEGTEAIIDLMNDSRLSIYSFSNTVKQVAPLTDVAGHEYDLKNSIESLKADDQTDLGNGLKDALEYLKKNKTPGRKGVVILFTDGTINIDGIANGMTKNDLLTYIGTNWKDGVIEVYTIGTGQEIDKAMLQQIADTTLGKFYQMEADSNGTSIAKNIADALSLACEPATDGLLVTFYPLSSDGMAVPLGSTGQAVVNVKNIRNRRNIAEISVFGTPPKINNWMWIEDYKYDNRRHLVYLNLEARETKSLAINVFGGQVRDDGKIYVNARSMLTNLTSNASKDVSIVYSEDGIDVKTPEPGWMGVLAIAVISAVLFIL